MTWTKLEKQFAQEMNTLTNNAMNAGSIGWITTVTRKEARTLIDTDWLQRRTRASKTSVVDKAHITGITKAGDSTHELVFPQHLAQGMMNRQT